MSAGRLPRRALATSDGTTATLLRRVDAGEDRGTGAVGLGVEECQDADGLSHRLVGEGRRAAEGLADLRGELNDVHFTFSFLVSSMCLSKRSGLARRSSSSARRRR